MHWDYRCRPIDVKYRGIIIIYHISDDHSWIVVTTGKYILEVAENLNAAMDVQSIFFYKARQDTN